VIDEVIAITTSSDVVNRYARKVTFLRCSGCRVNLSADPIQFLMKFASRRVGSVPLPTRFKAATRNNQVVLGPYMHVGN
jgi:hypothetical protein